LKVTWKSLTDAKTTETVTETGKNHKMATETFLKTETKLKLELKIYTDN